MVIETKMASAYKTAMLEKLLYFPRKNNPHTCKEWKEFAITLQFNGESLQGWFIERKNAPLLIYYGGNAEDISLNVDFAAKFPDVSLLLINYRGYGSSSGTPSEKDLLGGRIGIYDYSSIPFTFYPRVFFLWAEVWLRHRSLCGEPAAGAGFNPT